MRRRMCVSLIVLSAVVVGCQPDAGPSPRQTGTAARPMRQFPAFVTPYDIMTEDDEFYFHHLNKLTQGGEVAEWPLVMALKDIGADLIDADMLARMADGHLNISEQPRAAAIAQMVDECANVLGITAPPVFIEGNPVPNACVSGLIGPHVLVLTSGLVELYSETPDELRFVIGHELGHIRAQHLRTLLVGRIVMTPLMQRLSEAGSGTISRLIASTAGSGLFGILLHWYREAEFSADRAGLICVGGNVDTAQQALLRMLHQTRQSNPLMDQDRPGFDADRVLADQSDLKKKPIVALLSFVHQLQASHPFIADRCVQIRNWASSDEYRSLLRRPALSPLQLEILEVDVRDIPATDTYVPMIDSGDTDPFVELSYNSRSLTSVHVTDSRQYRLSNVDARFNVVAGAGLIVDLYDYNAVLPNRLVASGRLPVDHVNPGEYVVEGRLASDMVDLSRSAPQPLVRVKYRIEAAAR